MIKNIKLTELEVNNGQIEGLPKNPRFIKDDRFKKLVKSIEDDPEMLVLRELIVFPLGKKYIIICGNMRYRALQQIGYKDAPCKVLSPDTPVEKLQAYAIKDNIPFGSDDWELLANEWDEAKLGEWGLELPFDFNKLDIQEDDYVIPDEIKTDIVLGDLFEIGQHRLLCGDSTNAEDVERLLAGGKPNLMITDPPYGVDYDANWRNEADRKDGRPCSDRATGKVNNDDNSEWRLAYELSPAHVCYVWHASASAIQFAIDLMSCGYEIRNQIIWAKNNIVISRGHYHWKHEPCWYAVKKGHKANWIGDRSQTTVWNIDKPLKSETGHSTQKPIECMAKAIRNHSGDVHDPFLGSGTTMVAAHQLNRKCYGMEIDPKYCQVIIDRMLKLDSNIVIKKNGKIYKNNSPHVPHVS